MLKEQVLAVRHLDMTLAHIKGAVLCMHEARMAAAGVSPAAKKQVERAHRALVKQTINLAGMYAALLTTPKKRKK